MSGSAELLVVGAGPTGLTLAAQLAAHVRARIIDRGLDQAHESRSLTIQPRTLEILASLGVTDRLVAAGNLVDAVTDGAEGRAGVGCSAGPALGAAA